MAVMNALTLPLQGMSLIEASAGTGKTYTISSLYLRLLLGQGEQPPLTVDQILVVTFTRAATREIRDRIRQRIAGAVQAFLQGVSDDPFVNELIVRSEDTDVDTARLQAALRQIDEAAIYTIHGFCQRILSQHAFASGVLFDMEFITDQQQLKLRAVQDFWRRHFYPLESSMAAQLLRYWQSPEGLLWEIDSWLMKPDLQFMPDFSDVDLTSLEKLHRDNLARLNAFKAQWNAQVNDIASLIERSGVNKNRYSKRNLPNWLAQITDYAQGTATDRPATDYVLPDNLYRFSQTELQAQTSKGSAPTHAVFEMIDELLRHPPNLKPLLLQQALIQTRQLLEQNKARLATLAPDDLLWRLAEALKGASGDVLARAIGHQYPVAMIDEFQDTDSLQYDIYQRVYADNAAAALLMIGDPKQAIYGFRGADIFTYITARRQMGDNRIFTLDTNYRSSATMVTGVNALFGFAEKPFVYDQDIPFQSVNSAHQGKAPLLMVNGTCRDGLALDLLSGEQQGMAVSREQYRTFFSRHYAADIAQLLLSAAAGNATIGERAVQAHDIAVLVRDRHEAASMQKALQSLGIPSAFVSDDSVFHSAVADDVYRLLLACAEPTQESLIRASLASALFDKNAVQLDELFNHDDRWEALLIQFAHYQQYWLKHGVMALLRRVMQQFELTDHLLSQPGGERLLTDFLHIGELLQAASVERPGPQQLLRWFREHHLAQGRAAAQEHQMRLESDRNLVQIVTVHKSKGLEYAVVYLPFGVGHRAASQAQFHDEDNQRLWVDLHNAPQHLQLADQERLAEDLRLLYVALTRSVHRCVIGICNLKASGGSRDSVFHRTALGYLLSHGSAEAIAESELKNRLLQLQAQAPIQMQILEADHRTPTLTAAVTLPLMSSLRCRKLHRKLSSDWVISSYSALSHDVSHSQITQRQTDSAAVQFSDYDATTGEVSSAQSRPAEPEKLQRKTIFNFPRGAQAGIVLHGIFESIRFDQLSDAELDEQVSLALQRHGFDEQWQPVVSDRVRKVLATPLNADKGLQLSCIDKRHRLVEMEFYLPLAPLSADQLTQTLKRYGYLQDSQLGFARIQGMLKGYIDLVIEHDNCFYVLDYKSNHLGDDLAAYKVEMLQQAVSEHRYDLQYLLYTLAVHRYLKQRLPDYQYQQHFGGVYYLFLRGMNGCDNRSGVFSDRPTIELINELDALFAGETASPEDSEAAGVSLC